MKNNYVNLINQILKENFIAIFTEGVIVSVVVRIDVDQNIM